MWRKGKTCRFLLFPVPSRIVRQEDALSLSPPLIYRSVRFVVPLSFRFSFFFLPRETTIISKRIDSRVEATEQLLSALGRFEASTRKQSQEGEKDSS